MMARNMAGMKKAAMAQAAVGWLPQELRKAVAAEGVEALPIAAE